MFLAATLIVWIEDGYLFTETW